MMVVGDGADYIFGGMDGLLSKDWTFENTINVPYTWSLRRYLSSPPT